MKGVTVSPTKTRVVELPVGRMFVKLDGVSLNRGENRSTGRVVLMKSRASSEICEDDDSMGQEMLGWEMPWMQLGRAAMACHGFGVRILPSVLMLLYPPSFVNRGRRDRDDP